jgi:hypothetical protein
MQKRFLNSSICHSMAAPMPSSSRMGGRSSVVHCPVDQGHGASEAFADEIAIVLARAMGGEHLGDVHL